ncbi:MAG: ImmA/IrrE family metallo-endopeptidase [Gemmataceae bacterium]|nr:ImmA/IrrE family metallo-endopeptidase [Gemmataceae bacterium]
MMSMTDQSRPADWLAAVEEAATLRRIGLPSFAAVGMGGVRSATTERGRFVTLKRRAVADAQAATGGVVWALWHELGGSPAPVAAFRESAHPFPEKVDAVLSVLRGWLIDGWPSEMAKSEVSRHPNALAVRDRLPPDSGDRQEYDLSPDQRFGFVVEKGRWSVQSKGKSLTSWRMRKDRTGADSLDLLSLDRLCEWMAKHWSVIAYGGDVRPLPLRHYQVAASRAYENAELAHATKSVDVALWWSCHAVRSVDAELPNLFFERQGDVLVVSWDASPTPTKFYEIPTGEEAVKVDVAIPALRSLLEERLKLVQEDAIDNAASDLILGNTASAGYSAVRRYNPEVTNKWLLHSGFLAGDAQDFAATGTSRHPVVGLLRSSQGSSLKPGDCEAILKLLRPSIAVSYAKLRDLAKGLLAAINSHEPWESGYRLARSIRERLGLAPTVHIDMDRLVHETGVTIADVALDDPAILGACVGAPDYAPLVVLNLNCEDAKGISGRRVTLAHEFCHLLFDRAGFRSLARFEGAGADSDRLIEMRANAFAIELLVPMSTLIDTGGGVVAEEQLPLVAEERKVSTHALRWHVRNLRNRLTQV